MKRRGYIAPVQFSEEEIPDAEKRKAINDGLNAMTGSMLSLVEFCIAQRLKLYLEVFEKGLKNG